MTSGRSHGDDGAYGYHDFRYGAERNQADTGDGAPGPTPAPTSEPTDGWYWDDHSGRWYWDDPAADHWHPDPAAPWDAEPTGVLPSAVSGDRPWTPPADDHDDDDAEGCDDLAATVTRRRFLAGLAVSGAVGYTAFWAMGRGDEVATLDPTTTTTPTTRPSVQVTNTPPVVPEAEEPVEEVDPNLLTPAPVDERILVLIELEGGNDGPSTVVPYTNGAYYDLRPNLAIPAESVLAIDDEVGLNPALARLHGRQLAVVEGVGPVEGSLSHFEMVARWEQGDLYGNQGLRTGFLGRLADSLDDGSPTIGLSVAGFTPRFINVSASTLSLDDLNSLRILVEDEWIMPAYRQAVAGFSGGPMTTTMTTSWRHLVEIGDALPGRIENVDQETPMVQDGRKLGRQLAAAAQVLTAGIGVRVVHASLNGFDTHQGHGNRHENLMTQVDAAVDGFLQLMADAGLAERVLVATTSEFGRRMSENGNGLDHGAASTMLLWGPVVPGRHGEPSPLGDLDQRGNLRTTVPFDAYLGLLAQDWLGVEAASVLPTAPQPLAGVIPA